MDKQATMFTTCIAQSLKDIESRIDVMRKEHEVLNENSKIKINVQPDPKTVNFNGTNGVSFNITMHISNED